MKTNFFKLVTMILLLSCQSLYAQNHVEIFEAIPKSYSDTGPDKHSVTRNVNFANLPDKFTTDFNGKSYTLELNNPLSSAFFVELASGKAATYVVPKFFQSTVGVNSLTFPLRGKRHIYGLLDNQSVEPFDTDRKHSPIVSGKLEDIKGLVDSIYCEQLLLPNRGYGQPKGYDAPAKVDASDICIKLYIEVDYDIYDQKGSVQEVVNYITSMFNEVNTIFYNDGINVVLHKMFIWDKPSPYTNQSSGGMLNQFGNHRRSFDGDLAQLLSYKSSGGIAYVDALCFGNTAVRMSFCNIKSSFQSFPRYSWSVMVMTHELGHNLGSQHTHSCSWNGNNTAIDNCMTTEGGCNSELGVPQEGGTIMSYCHLKNVGINFNLGFGPQPKLRIHEAIATAPCLTGDCDRWDYGDGDNNGNNGECVGAELILEFTPDLFGSENKYSLMDENDNILYQMGPFADKEKDKTYLDTICVPAGCYRFEFVDTFEDGLCCEYGDGQFKLTIDGTQVLQLGGYSQFVTLYDFCTDDVKNCDLPIITEESVVTSYGSDQDSNSPFVQSGNSITLGNNSWKSIMLPEPIVIGKEDVLIMEVKTEGTGEIHGFGFDNDDHISFDLTFQFHGTQNWGILSDDWIYEGKGEWQTIEIAIGNVYSVGKAGVEFDRVFFTNDFDAGASSNVKTHYRNIRLVHCGE